MKIFIGTDHAGYVLKEKLVAYLKAEGHEVIDKGAFGYNETDDYPDFVIPVAQEISKDPENTRGIILGATGEGEAIAANKFHGVRAIIVRSREHNNSNIMSLGARFLTEEQMVSAVDLWLKTPYSFGERHVRRLGKIDQIKDK